MKKIIPILILAVIVFTCFAFHVSAETSDFTAEDAYNLYINYNELTQIFYSGGSSNEEPEIVRFSYSRENTYIRKSSFSADMKGYEFLSFTLDGKTYETSTLDKFRSLLKLYMVRDLVSNTIEELEKSEAIKADETGKLFCCPLGADVVNSETVGYSDFIVDGNAASIKIIRFVHYWDGIKVKRTTYKFKIEDNIWKVSEKIIGSEEDITEEYFKNPSTGSPTPIYITLAGAAVLCALPVVKRKRRT